jgi:uncharacterized membrane protein YdjX (TVP38/TMEM64 family)
MSPDIGDMRETAGEIQIFASPRSRRRFLKHAVVVLVVLSLLTYLFRRHISLLRNPRELRRIIRGFGFLGPLVIIGLQAAQVVVAPVPGQVLALVAGYLYGPWLGTLYNMVGVMIGSTIAFWLARRYGRSYVETIVHEETLARFDTFEDTQVRIALLAVFLIPGLPDDVICFIGGLTRLPLWQLVAIAVVGRAPGFFLVNVFGGFIETGRYDAAFILGIVLLVLSAAGYLSRNWLFGLFDRTE